MRWEFIKERFLEKRKKTRFRPQKKVRHHDLDHAIDQKRFKIFSFLKNSHLCLSKLTSSAPSKRKFAITYARVMWTPTQGYVWLTLALYKIKISLRTIFLNIRNKIHCSSAFLSNHNFPIFKQNALLKENNRHLTRFLGRINPPKYRVFINYCVFSLKFGNFSELCQFCCSAGVLPAWCMYTHWHQGKTEKGQSVEYSKIFGKNTIFN